MIQAKVKALFNFIEFLSGWQKDYIRVINPLVKKKDALYKKYSKLDPYDNYKDKALYDDFQMERENVISDLRKKAVIPIQQKLDELGIWNGDSFYPSIYNENIDAVQWLKQNYDEEDIDEVQESLRKYLSFRQLGKTDFLGLHNAFDKLDALLTPLIEYFLPDNKGEFRKIKGSSTPSDKLSQTDAINISPDQKKNISPSSTSVNYESNPYLHQEIFKDNAFIVWQSMWESFDIKAGSRTDTRFMIDVMRKDGLIHKGVTYTRILDWISETYQIIIGKLPYKNFKNDTIRNSIYRTAKNRLKE